MSQIVVRQKNKTTPWNIKLRPRVSDTCSYNNARWYNVTGANSEPGIGNDWKVDSYEGGIPAPKFRFIASNDTLSISTDETVQIVSSGLTITLPTAVGHNQIFDIKQGAPSTTVNASGGQNIDGSASIIMNLQNQSLTLQSNGSNWFVK